MRYFYHSKLLIVLFLIPIGFVYAQAHDSRSLDRLAHNSKKRCCYYTSIGQPYFVSWFSEGYNDDSARYAMAYLCSHGPWPPHLAVVDPTATVVGFGQYGDSNDPNAPFPGGKSIWAKKINYIRCERHATICGYADPNVSPNAYNATNCREA